MSWTGQTIKSNTRNRPSSPSKRARSSQTNRNELMQDTNSPQDTDEKQPAKRSTFITFLPLIFLGLLAALFVWGLKFNPNAPNFIPSVLIGKKIDFTLEKMEGLNDANGKPVSAFSSETLSQGNVSVINIWASWCIACRAEHKYLKRLAKRSGVPVYGLNYKDTASAGRKFLARFGNPYTAVGMDRRGRVGIDFGVYGVPETFVIDGKGFIRHKITGPINDKIITDQLLPAIKKAQALSAQ